MGKKELATFAAGCFWSVELVFQRLPGVLSTQVGYTQGHKANPTYQEVCSGQTGHAEAVQLEYDPEEVTYDKLLDVFWKKHNPTTLNRQGNDIGTQYRSGIYYHNEQQKEAAERTKQEVTKKLGKTVVTEILPAKEFWPAEDYHQRYLEKGGQCAAKGCTDTIRCYG
ncbi:Peptide methionine sulfoxide reductase A2-1 [Balamuthia mandrillaris]